jgi:putative glycosyltransferase (TIGR04348 family)
MNIRLICPVPRASRHGNMTSALRWSRILKSLGHRVVIEETYKGANCDLLLALHAWRSADSVELFSKLHPELPIVLALTGTDLYQDIHEKSEAQRSLELATRMMMLQPLGMNELPIHVRDKARSIFQSARQTPGGHQPSGKMFNVSVIGHLRPVKDPMRTALAARLLPESSQLQVIQVGGAMNSEMEVTARAETASNPRYRWLGEMPRWKARRVMAKSQAMVLTSLAEGGANVVSEALADGIPVISSRIAGSVGMLGEDYPGYYETGDEHDLARVLTRLENEPAFLQELKQWCTDLSAMVSPAMEQSQWNDLVQEAVQAKSSTLTTT